MARRAAWILAGLVSVGGGCASPPAAPPRPIAAPPRPVETSAPAPPELPGPRFTLAEPVDLLGKPAATALSRDGRLLALAGEAAVVIRDRDVERRETARIEVTAPISDLRFAPDDGALAITAGDGVHIVRPDGAELQVIRGLGTATSVRFSPDGQRLAVNLDESVTSLWDLGARRELHKLAGTTEAFSPDGKALLTSALRDGEVFGDHDVRLWDVQKGTAIRSFKGLRGYLTFADEGRTLVGLAGDSGVLKRVPVAGKGAAREHYFTDTLRGQLGPMAQFGLSPDGRLALGGRSTLELFDTGTGEPIAELSGHDAQPEAAAFSGDGRTVATRGADGVRLWNVATGGEVRRLAVKQGKHTALAFSPDGRALADGQEDGGVRLWEAGGPRWIGKLGSAVTAFSFSEDGRALTASDGHRERTWDVAGGARLRDRLLDVSAPAEQPQDVSAVSPGRGVTAKAREDGGIELVTDRKMVLRLLPRSAYALTDDAVEVFGPEPEEAARALVCRAEGKSYPFAACRARFGVKGLLERAFAGKR